MAIKEFMVHSDDNGSELKLGIDENGNLYVNNKRVITDTKIVLEGWVNGALFIGGLSTLGLFLLEFYKLCKC